MSKTSSTTATKTGKLNFLNSERVSFQTVLDLFERAMRDESMFYLSGASIQTDIGIEICDKVAKSWANCATALQTLQMIPHLSKLISLTAKSLEQLLPGNISEDFDFKEHIETFSQSAKNLRSYDLGLAEQIMGASMVFHTYEASVKLAKLQRVYVSE